MKKFGKIVLKVFQIFHGTAGQVLGDILAG